MAIQQFTGTLVARYWSPLSSNLRGIIWMLLSALIFIALQTVTKFLGSRFDSIELTFFRYLFGSFVIFPFLIRTGLKVFATRRPVLHLSRSLIGVAAMYLMVYAVTHMPLADVTVINFSKPLFMIFLAVAFLGERVRWRRWTATAAGFIGVIIMLRPAGGIDLAAMAALAAAACFALAHVFVKKLTVSERPMTVMAYYTVISASVTLGPTIYVWVTPDLAELGLLIMTGILSASAQTCIVYSLRLGEATLVSPFDYTRLIWAVLFGYLFFAELPDAWMGLGAAIIIASNLYIAHRARRSGGPRD